MEALKLRGNFLPTQVRSVRGRHRTALSCDLSYGNRPESLGHILQHCPASGLQDIMAFSKSTSSASRRRSTKPAARRQSLLLQV